MRDELRLRAGAEWREIEGEIVAVDMRTATYLSVNESGSVLWPSLARGTRREDLIGALVDRFDIEPRAAATDVDAFVAMLVEQDLLEP